MLGRAEFGLHLVRPWRVVLSGRPNVGKSSLINALVGYQRAIVYDQPGTTRDVVTAETALDGWPFEFADTAGLRTGGDELETAGIARARETLARADCRVLVFDASEPIEADDLRLLAEWPNAIVVANKCDLAPSREASLPPAALRLSALTGNGLDSLAREIVRRVVPNPPAAAEPIPVTERQIDLLRRAHAAAIESRFADAERALSECLGARQVTDGTTMPAEFRTPRS
ncbi:MAG: 50S ribosome-binding GTPase [Planctomycetes bacterium]|nr:50S ribosome-binding GTPase [Planctomycetota bacterium]